MKKLILALFISFAALLSGCVAPTAYRVVPVAPPQQIIVIREYPTYYYPSIVWRFDVGWRIGHRHHHRR
jgi:hypothetical protein